MTQNLATNNTENNRDTDSLKELMISFVCQSLALTPTEQQSLIQHSSELTANATLPDLITHLKSKNLETELIEKIKVFGREDVAL